jgi:hypothetical protein
LPLVVAAFLIYLVFQIHAAVFHGYWGQDFTQHKGNISLAAHDPWNYITTYREGRTDPPLYHLLGGFVQRVIGLPNYLLAIGFMNVVFGLAGMIALYALACRLIASPVLRLAAIVFLLFLPFAMIHAEVIAADALATPLLLVFVWTAIRLADKTSPRSFAIAVAAASLVLLAGVLTKFTFASAIIGSALSLALLWWTRVLTARRMALAFLLLTIIPALLAYAQMRQYTSQQTYNLGLRPHPSLQAIWNAEMNPRTILFLRRADTDVLAAPSYDWRREDFFELLKPNKHSLPALEQLGVFTDVLNIYQYDPADYYFGRRTVPNLHRMQVAVRTGIAFSLMALIGLVVLFARSFVTVIIRRNAADAPILILLLFSLGWFFNIVALLPFLPSAYLSGGWLPRYVAPALLGFFLAGFVFLDRSKRVSRTVAVVVLVLALAQSSLHASFLWPAPSADAIYEPNEMVVHDSRPVLMRVASWQDGWAGRPGYWHGTSGYGLGKTLGILIDRHAGTGLETWQLSFIATAGPANPSPHRRIRISCQYCKSKTVDFDAEARVVVDVPIAPGRNDILLETLEPEQVVEKKRDPSVPLVRIAQIEFARSGVTAPWFFSTGPRAALQSVSPYESTARNQTFTVTISDEAGYNDVDYVYFLVDDEPAIPRFTCHGYYYRPTGAVLLYRDTTTQEAERGVLGSGPPLSNGRCTLDPAASSANGSGSRLTVNFALSLDPSYSKKKVYFWIKDHAGRDTGWIDTGTKWNVGR